jgi:uncharacterized protein (DUF305 family)
MGGRNRILCAACCGLALLLGGCLGGDDAPPSAGAPARDDGVNIVQAGAPGDASEPISADEAGAAANTPHTADDVDFMQGMLHHHAQALVMTGLAADQATGRVALIADRIDASQKSEMDVMKDWLTTRDEEIPGAEEHATEHGPDGELMPGMVGQQELTRLAAARGKAFNRLFVDYMIRHHQGALEMVGDLRNTAGGGAEPELDAFARHVDADQAIEISRLAELQAGLPEAPAGEIDFTGTPPKLCLLT